MQQQIREEALETMKQELRNDQMRGEALVRLRQNPDFKIVFDEYILSELIVQTTKRKGHPSSLTPQVQEDLDVLIMSLGRLDATLNRVASMATEAPLRMEQLLLEEAAFLAENSKPAEGAQE